MAPLTLLSLEPALRIAFPHGAGEKVTKTLTITNKSEESAAWKVRTAAPKAFLVMPRAGVLKAGEQVEAVITLLPESGETDLRFEVRATQVEADRGRLEREAWSEVPKRSIEVAELRAVVAGAPLPVPLAPSNIQGSDSGYRQQGVDDFLRSGPSSRPIERSHQEPDQQERGADDDVDEGYSHGRGYSGSRDDHAYDRSQPSGSVHRTADSRWLREQERSLRARPAAAASVRRPADLDAAAAKTKTASSSQKAPARDTKTKTILGILIGILIINLYLRPIIEAALQGDEPAGAA